MVRFYPLGLDGGTGLPRAFAGAKTLGLPDGGTVDVPSLTAAPVPSSVALVTSSFLLLLASSYY